jgi:hypothetical protein
MLELVSVSKVSSRYGEPVQRRLTPAQRKRVLPCPFCGGREVRLGHIGDTLRWAQCPTCGTDFVGTRALDPDVESLFNWWNWRNGVPGVPDALAVDSAIRCLKSAVQMLVEVDPKKQYNFVSTVEAVLAATSVALGELRGCYEGTFKKRKLRTPAGARRADRITR